MELNGLDVFGWLILWFGISSVLGIIVGRALKNVNRDK